MGFRFKQFSVVDDKSSMKVGTDAVLLGAWAGCRNPKNILDAGSGSGLIALMMAQRFQAARILGIDIHPGSIKQAEMNFTASPWRERLEIREISLQHFATKQSKAFDLIVSNPPFFNASLLPPDESKKMAKHTESLSYNELVVSIASLLHTDGSFALILPYENKDNFDRLAVEQGLFLSRELVVIPVKGKDPNRYLSEWTWKQQISVREELCIRENPGEYTEEYRKLTVDFYLAL